ncbi:MAG: 23S rRNA pseudouridine1911/1915/1917 synthase [Candidatus Paceibacteria bacterium]|jgi:23S rRNA pseudouridine1911/1915/1917 synthase
MNIEILFENENLLVINKPSGLVVHSDGKTDEPNLVDWVLENYPELNGIGENMFIELHGKEVELNRPGIVHRIDRDTSGCLVIAKTQESFDNLKDKFKNREIHKTYYALVYGHIKNDSGLIDQPIGRHTKDFRMKMAGESARGKLREAQTEYTVLNRYVDESKRDKQKLFEKYTLVECKPKTGRTHQIRVHLKWLNNPIVADSLYRGKRKHVLGLERTALHSQTISFDDIGGERITVSVDVPVDIQQSLDSLSIFL